MNPASDRQPLGKAGVSVPNIIFGTSCLGNLYQALPHETKRRIVAEWFAHVEPPVALDSAGKYGAGLALEELGRCLRELNIPGEKVILSNKLGWKRIPLSTPEPTFEPGAWVGLEHDAEQHIGYDGILACHRQGLELLGPGYSVALASVHDPDEYLAAAENPAERQRRFGDVLEAYRALADLKRRGEVRGVGVGAKDWGVIRELAEHVDFDWVMFACSLTIYHHPPELPAFIAELHRRNVGIVNSAVFHSGFLLGGAYFDYGKPTRSDQPELFQWREAFLRLCRQHDVSPAAACIQFGMSAPGVVATALNTSKPQRIKDNVAAFTQKIPRAFWAAMKDQGLMAKEFPYLP
ncbi:MAG: aldo/keto reductase [Phycisphaerae bacterium]|nr:aldo/keto reductase [Phycisphaerae bacterium]